MIYTTDEINAAIARGALVTGIAADLPRRGQPPRGEQVTIARAVSDRDWQRVSVRAVGYRAAFAVTDVVISDVDDSAI